MVASCTPPIQSNHQPVSPRVRGLGSQRPILAPVLLDTQFHHGLHSDLTVRSTTIGLIDIFGNLGNLFNAPPSITEPNNITHGCSVNSRWLHLMPLSAIPTDSTTVHDLYTLVSQLSTSHPSNISMQMSVTPPDIYSEN